MSTRAMVWGVGALLVTACGGAKTEEAKESSEASGGEQPAAASGNRCDAEVDEDGDTIVTSQEDDYVFVLGGNEWELSCVPGEAMALTASYAGFTVAVVTVGGTEAGNTVLADFATGVQKGLQKTTNYTPVEAKEEKLGEEQRSALCFNGPAEHEGTGLHVEGCVSARRAPAGHQVLSAVTWVGPKEALAEAGTQIGDGVRALTSSWMLISEIPDEPQ